MKDNRHHLKVRITRLWKKVSVTSTNALVAKHLGDKDNSDMHSKRALDLECQACFFIGMYDGKYGRRYGGLYE